MAVLTKLRRFFRPQLLVISLMSIFIWNGAGEIVEAIDQKSPYVVAYGEDGENLREVQRSDFLRHEITSSLVFVLVAVIFWGIAASSLKDSAVERGRSERVISELGSSQEVDASSPQKELRVEQLLDGMDGVQRYSVIVWFWTKACLSQRYKKEAWNSVVEQLKSLDVID